MRGDSIIIRSVRIASLLLQLWVTWTEPGGKGTKGTRQRWRFPELAPYRSHNAIGSFSPAPNDLGRSDKGVLIMSKTVKLNSAHRGNVS